MESVDRAQMSFYTNIHVHRQWFGVEADRIDFRAVELQVHNYYLTGSGGSDVITKNLGRIWEQLQGGGCVDFLKHQCRM